MITGIYVFLMGVIGLLLGITIERQRNRNIIVGTPSASHNNSRDAIFLEYIEAMADSPDTPSKIKIEHINVMINDWRSGKQHPVQ